MSQTVKDQFETTTREDDMERVVPERPHPKGPKRWCEHGFHPDRCLGGQEEREWLDH